MARKPESGLVLLPCGLAPILRLAFYLSRRRQAEGGPAHHPVPSGFPPDMIKSQPAELALSRPRSTRLAQWSYRLWREFTKSTSYRPCGHFLA
jgi:hypothetical protein